MCHLVISLILHFNFYFFFYWIQPVMNCQRVSSLTYLSERKNIYIAHVKTSCLSHALVHASFDTLDSSPGMGDLLIHNDDNR
jgi:hypothetical protein